jgi:hypothetical protein
MQAAAKYAFFFYGKTWRVFSSEEILFIPQWQVDLSGYGGNSGLELQIYVSL